MEIFLLISAICLIVFLFCFYALAHDDSLFLRRNISTEDIFNIVMAGLIIGLVFARLFYIIFNYNPIFLNPLSFFLINYYPGLSLSGGILSASVAIFLLSTPRKIPSFYLFDYVLLSFLPSIIIGMLISVISTLFLRNHFFYLDGLIILIFMILSIVIFKLFKRENMQEGITGFFTLFCFSGAFLLMNVLLMGIKQIDKSIFFSGGENYILIIIFISSLILLIKQGKFLSR